MSESDRAVLEHQLREAWGGPAKGNGKSHFVPLRGGEFVVPPVREGGTTDAFIKLAAEIADRHYTKLLEAEYAKGHARGQEVGRESKGWGKR